MLPEGSGCNWLLTTEAGKVNNGTASNYVDFTSGSEVLESKGDNWLTRGE